MRQGESKMVVSEHRSRAYMKYVSTGGQENAICRPPSRISGTASHAMSGRTPVIVRSITSRRAKDELILVTCGIAVSHSLWMRS